MNFDPRAFDLRTFDGVYVAAAFATNSDAPLRVSVALALAAIREVGSPGLALL